MEKFTGGCHCGEVRYEAEGEPMASAACHCKTCQTISGGGPAYVMVMPKDKVTVTKGQLRAYWVKGSSGHPIARYFCENCGTHVFAEGDGFPDVRTVKAGTLDDASVFHKNAVHIWTKVKAHFVHIHPEATTFEENPPIPS
ncbi:MAG: GFA family protein [Alphaproteobacteria bacterium]